MNLKEKLTNALGTFGGILFYIILLAVLVFPVGIVSSYYDLSWWANWLLLFGSMWSSFIGFIVWVVGLIATIKGPQDTFAIIYYIAFAVVNLSHYLIFIIGWIVSLFKKE
jgi:hypothetical protein